MPRKTTRKKTPQVDPVKLIQSAYSYRNAIRDSLPPSMRDWAYNPYKAAYNTIKKSTSSSSTKKRRSNNKSSSKPYTVNYNSSMSSTGVKPIIIKGYRSPRLPSTQLMGKQLTLLDRQQQLTSTLGRKRFNTLDTRMGFNNVEMLNVIFAQLGYTDPTYDTTGLNAINDSNRKVLVTNQLISLHLKNNTDRPARLKLYLVKLSNDILNKATGSLSQEISEGFSLSNGLAESLTQPMNVYWSDNKFLFKQNVVAIRTLNFAPAEQVTVSASLKTPQLLNFNYKARGTTSNESGAFVPNHKKGEYTFIVEFHGAVVNAVDTGASESVGIANTKIDCYMTKRFQYYQIANSNNQSATLINISAPATISDDIHSTDYSGGAIQTS